MQQILHGITNLQELLSDSSKVMIVTDSSFQYLSIKGAVEQIETPHVFFNDFSSNPLYEAVEKGIGVFNQEHCDAIVGIGGGSAIDVAKCIKLFCRMTGTTPYMQQPYEDTGIPLIAIPTTAGTGSESTKHAVIYYKGEKQSISHDSIIPNFAILEPSVLATLPLYQKKCTMLDALCQGIESWWSVNSTDESKVFSKRAVEGITRNWHSYIFDNDPDAAKEIMLAANLAGQAINITQTTAPHAFSYKLTSLFGLPHGHAVAVCLPPIWEYMIEHTDKCIDQRGTDYLSQTFCDISEALNTSSPTEAISVFNQNLSLMGIIPPTLQDVNKEDMLNTLSSSVNPIRLKNNPVALHQTEIKQIYDRVLAD